MMGMQWIASFVLIVVGIFLLIRGVSQILKAVGGPVLLKLPLTQKSGQFMLTNTGNYAIWQSGRMIHRAPVKMAMPTILAVPTGDKLMVHSTLSSVRVNNGFEGRIQVYRFWAQAGQYQLEVTTDFSDFNPKSPYFLEIRELKPGYLLVFGILLVVLAGGCLIGGLIIPFV